MKTYETEISEYMWDAFLIKFDKYKKKAVKLGFAEPTFKILEVIQDVLVNDNDNPLKKVPIANRIEVTYDLPIIKGWKVVGNRERLDGNIFTNVVTEDNCAAFHRSTTIGCDHCQTNRLRNKSILLKNEKSNSIIEVGSTCVKDFFGHSVTSIDYFVDQIFSEDEWGGGSGDCFRFPLEDVLRFTSFYIRKFGYVKSNEDAYTTKDRIWDCHLSAKYRSKQYIKPEMTNEDEEMACAVLDYWSNLDPEKNYDNTYTTNLIKIAQIEWLEPKLLGYAVSMVSSYQGIMDKEETEKNMLPSEYQGNVGNRIKDIPAKVKFKTGWETRYGWTTLITFIDPIGNVYVTFYKGQKETPERNQDIMLTGTVTEHSEFKDIKQTCINRIAWEAV